MDSINSQEKIKELKLRADKLNSAVIRLNADVENAQENLDKLLAQALADFGTQDVGELRRKLEQMHADNTAIITKAEKELGILESIKNEKQEALLKIKSGV